MLYTVDIAQAATAALRAHDDGDALANALEDSASECTGRHPERRFDCMLHLAPNAALAIAEWGVGPTSVGVARIENGAVTARRTLYAASAGSGPLTLSSADLDDDGQPELIVEMDLEARMRRDLAELEADEEE